MARPGAFSMSDLPTSLLAGTSTLALGDAAAAILVLPDGRYVLQERDPDPAIWYPGHWGLFGGSIDGAETPEAALRRELAEELELTADRIEFFLRAEYDYAPSCPGRSFTRTYFTVPISEREVAGLVLHEGRSFGIFSPEDVFSRLRMAPYDGFVLFLHAGRDRIKLPGTTPKGPAPGN